MPCSSSSPLSGPASPRARRCTAISGASRGWRSISCSCCSCGGRAGELAGRGYRIEPAPVRLSVGAFLALYAAAIALLLVPALLLGPRPAMPEAEPFSAADTEAREALEELGLPEWLAGSLTQEELALCEGALWAKDCGIEMTGDTALDGGQLEMEVWAVGLADGRSRFYAAFRWLEPPRFRLQEALGLEPDGNEAISEVSGALVYEKDGDTLAAPLPVVLGGGQTAEELDDMARAWYEVELERLGHVQYVPRSDFALPFGAEGIRGWLAFTYDGGMRSPGPARSSAAPGCCTGACPSTPTASSAPAACSAAWTASSTRYTICSERRT
ncbi:MAG: hypothetical protein ACLTSG_14150 [Lachnospiraceae bacterium]